jgi:hypothetical protein
MKTPSTRVQAITRHESVVSQLQEIIRAGGLDRSIFNPDEPAFWSVKAIKLIADNQGLKYVANHLRRKHYKLTPVQTPCASSILRVIDIVVEDILNTPSQLEQFLFVLVNGDIFTSGVVMEQDLTPGLCNGHRILRIVNLNTGFYWDKAKKDWIALTESDCNWWETQPSTRPF